MFSCQKLHHPRSCQLRALAFAFPESPSFKGLGAAMQRFTGEMVHTELRRASLAEFPKLGLHVAAINYAAWRQRFQHVKDVRSVEVETAFCMMHPLYW